MVSKFSGSDFLKQSNNLAIRRRLHAVTSTFDHFTLNVCSATDVMYSKIVPNLSKIEQAAAELLIT